MTMSNGAGPTSGCSEFGKLGRGGAIRTSDPWRPRERNRFRTVYRFSRIPNIYSPGNLLSLKEGVHRMERIGFGHSFGTVEKQGHCYRLVLWASNSDRVAAVKMYP